MESNKNYYNPYKPTKEPYDIHPSQMKMLRIILRDSGRKPGFVLDEDSLDELRGIIRRNKYTYYQRLFLNDLHLSYKNIVDSTFEIELDDFLDMGYPSEEVEKIKKDKLSKKGVGGYYL